MKKYRGKITETQRDILMWMWKNLAIISKEKLSTSGKERFMPDTDFLIPWTPSLSFNLNQKKDKDRYSRSLKILEDKGYLKRIRSIPKGPIAYSSFTNDGIFIVKTWARIVESGEEDEFSNFSDIEKGFEREDSDSMGQWVSDDYFEEN